MAGSGKRFIDEGIKIPKYLVEVRGKTLLEWSLSSLPLSVAERILFIGSLQHEKDYEISKTITNMLQALSSKIEYLWLDKTTGGQAETVLCGKDHLSIDKPLLIFNIDTYFISKGLADKLKSAGSIGYLGAFYNSSNSYSYAKVNGDNYVTQVAEKEPISKYALTGMYHFSKTRHFLEVAEENIRKGDKVKGEYYISPMYNQLIDKGYKFKLDICDSYAILGTPEEVRRFDTCGAIENRDTQ